MPSHRWNRLPILRLFRSIHLSRDRFGIVFPFQNPRGSFHRIFRFEVEVDQRIQSLLKTGCATCPLRFEILDAFQLLLQGLRNSQAQLQSVLRDELHPFRRRFPWRNSGDFFFELASRECLRFLNPFYLIRQSQNGRDLSRLGNGKRSALNRRLENRNFTSFPGDGHKVVRDALGQA